MHEARATTTLQRFPRAPYLILVIAALLPLSDLFLPREYQFAAGLRPVFIFALVALGLNIITGFCGLLTLGIAGFMALGAYTYAIASCDIYPFQCGFWLSLLATIPVGASIGTLLALPTLRLRGDYIAIVTMGFGEITQDLLRNVDEITKGTQGINPLPGPTFFGWSAPASQYLVWYYLLLGFLLGAILMIKNLLASQIGRTWFAVRSQELAMSCMGINPARTKLLAFAMGSALCAFSGGLWASFLGSTGDPGNYDFQISVMILCILIVGGMGEIAGVLIGAVVVIGFNSLFLTKLTTFLAAHQLISGTNVLSNPSNWKFLVFGLALVMLMRFRPRGFVGQLEG